MSDSVDTIILHQELAYADSLPLRVLALGAAPSATRIAAWNERNLRLLHGHLDAELGVRAPRPRRRLAWILLGLLAVLAGAVIWRLGGFTG